MAGCLAANDLEDSRSLGGVGRAARGWKERKELSAGKEGEEDEVEGSWARNTEGRDTPTPCSAATGTSRGGRGGPSAEGTRRECETTREGAARDSERFNSAIAASSLPFSVRRARQEGIQTGVQGQLSRGREVKTRGRWGRIYIYIYYMVFGCIGAWLLCVT